MNKHWMNKHWKHLSHKIVHKNPWYLVRQDKVLTPEGKNGTYNVIEKRPAAFIVAVDTQNRVALIKLYRYPTKRNSIEIPAGGIENEPPLKAAKRELMEETGLTAKHWKKISVTQVANSTMDQLGYYYVATGLNQKVATGRKEEGISAVMFVPFNKVIQMIMNGEITDSNSISALLMAAITLKTLKS
jgi:8-oxo-dGTP pyrophosphatase MutT (NUDIX family)